LSEIYENLNKFNDNLIKRIYGRLTGTDNESESYIGDWPSERFPAGNLSHLPENRDAENYFSYDNSEDVPQYVKSSYSPQSMGIAFYHSEINMESEIEISGYFNVFIPIFPGREDILKYNEERRSDTTSKLLVPRKFARRKKTFGLRSKLSKIGRDIYVGIPVALEDSENPAESRMAFSGESFPKEIDFAAIATDKDYEKWVKELLVTKPPEWKVQITLRETTRMGKNRLEVFLVNRTESSPMKEKNKWYFDPFIFAPKLKIKLNNLKLVGVRLDEIEGEDYRFATNIYATGRNCHAITNVDESFVESEILPVFNEYALETPKNEDIPDESYEFLKLGENDPIPLLKSISVSMHKYLDHWIEKAKDYRGDPVDQRNAAAWEQMSEFKKKFSEEVERFDLGIMALSDLRVRKAFQLTNLSFHERLKYSDTYNRPKWRLFQLVFVVSFLPEMLARESKSSETKSVSTPVSLISFPTGAGKTEAFTGAVIVQAFYDRMRGKDFGVTAWMKFPLRFLTLQQLERAVMAIEAANIVLDRERSNLMAIRSKFGFEGEFSSFSVGYFVGSSASPNDPSYPIDGQDSPLTLIQKKDPRAKEYLSIETCPRCMLIAHTSEKLHLEADMNRERIIFKCSKCGAHIPYLITDTEIYSNPPTILISTIDKGAVFGRVPQAQSLLGAIRTECKRHGYSPFLNCWKKVCKEGGISVNRLRYDLPPSIVIQDEIHMLDESLGTLSSIYETFLQQLAERSVEMGVKYRGAWKIIASSATISGYERHIRGLYLRNSILFPSKGPSADESFYFKRSDTAVRRKIVGFLPHNMTHPNSVIKTIQYFLEYRKGYFSGQNDFTEEAKSSLLPYITTAVAYGNVKSEIYQIEQSIEDQINPYLREQKLPPIEKTGDLTGDTSGSATQDLMRELTNGEQNKMPELVVATSAISHGVDIERLNFIVFRGQPRNAAEFIQSYSRIGRKYQGVVLVVYNPNRERDSSHYTLHNELLSVWNVLLLSPSLDRYSKKGMDACSGGIIFGNSIFGQKNKSLVMSNKFLEFIRDSGNRQNVMTQFQKSYYPDWSNDANGKKSEILNYAENLFANKIKDAGNEFELRSKEYTTDLLDCMTSLRQTDKTIDMVINDFKTLMLVKKFRKQKVD
jgi:hypothetical protein